MNNLFVIFLLSCNILSTYAQARNASEYLPHNYVKDGSIDYTDYIQKSLNENQIVLFPDFPILINDKGLYLKSHQEIIFQGNSKLILKNSAKAKYALIHINNLSNVTLKNIRIKGDRYSHKDQSGEWGMGIEIRNSKNVTIQNPEISQCWGDGIYIAGKETINISIYGGSLKNNRRNGISIISGNNIHIKNILIEETRGTWPMSAIDIEPNSSGNDSLGKIHLENIISRNNSRGISIVLSNYLSATSSLIDIIISNFESTGDDIAIKINPFVNNKTKSKKTELKGIIKFENATITKSKEPILIKGKKEDYLLAPNFVFTNISVDKKSYLVNKIKTLNSKKFYMVNP